MSNIDEKALNAITEKIIGCGFAVSNALGCGFLEKIYENALCHELAKRGLTVDQQQKCVVIYDGIAVGEYFADIVVEGTVLVEVKAVKALDEVHAAQVINFLKASALPCGLLMNFARPKLHIRRFANRMAPASELALAAPQECAL